MLTLENALVHNRAVHAWDVNITWGEGVDVLYSGVKIGDGVLVTFHTFIMGNYLRQATRFRSVRSVS